MTDLDAALRIANGPALTLSELWRDRHLILWFSRGLACPFCRRQMVQFAQIQAALAERQTLAVQITGSDLETAGRMLEFFPVSWPYACDPEGLVAKKYGLEPPEGAVARMVGEVKQQTRALGLLLKHPGEPHPEALPAVTAAPAPAAVDGGMVIVARGGRVGYRQPSGKLSLLPSNDQLLQRLSEVIRA
jgi:peroxiredoxin